MADVCSSGQIALGLQLLDEQLAQPCPGWLQLHLACKISVGGDKVAWYQLVSWFVSWRDDQSVVTTCNLP